MHSGVSTTLNEIRAKYWPLKGYATVKSIINECFTCKKAHARLAGQQMATLPNWRTTPSPPFTHVGVDYAGPLYVTKTGTQKRYILLFTCGSTRALHLEMTATLEKEDFLLAYSSFAARRGVPSAFYSDNGTTFVAASKALPDIRWNFSTPLSPWHGGLWERMVRSVKTPLRKVIGDARLKEAELRVVLTQVEAVVNSRPLVRINNDDSVVVTPAELIAGRRLQQLDETTLVFAPSKRMAYLTALQEQFWRQWRSRYLPSLQERPKWGKKQPDVKEGDIVLLLKENSKRHTWPLAKVTETVTGRDGLVRTVKLRCDDKEFVRPVQNVVPLEGQHDRDDGIAS